MDKPIEILAPAGSIETMRAAMNAGCDAVYLGGTSFGARAYANNLEEEILLRAIDEAHIRDKKLYLTVNTLLKEKELTEQLYRFLNRFYLQGLDAVIVQDVGVIHFIHRNFPKLPIHASTQTTLTMAQGAGILKASGITRLVTARELSLAEIKNISENTDLEIETFVHGALCYCYSGQCLMSSMIGGRSGNRGRCAQPCRMTYQLYSENQKISSDSEKYLLSPKDINTMAMIPELMEAGIHSFKIEGRMKRPEYAAAVSAVYRNYADYYMTYGKEAFHRMINGKEFAQDQMDLLDIYNRGGFCTGYGHTYHGKSMMSMVQPNHSGVQVGDILSVNGTQAVIRLKEAIHAQDILEIRQKDKALYEFTVKDGLEEGRTFTANIGTGSWKKEDKTIGYDRKDGHRSPDKIRAGDPVYRTKNQQLLERLAKDYIDKDKKQPVTGTLTARLGEKLAFTLYYKDITVAAYHDIVQAAVKQPVTVDRIKDSLQKTGDTLYYFEELNIDADENIFIPVAWLNEIRREAVQRLSDAVTGRYRRDHEKDSFGAVSYGAQEVQDRDFGICVSVQTPEQLFMSLSFHEITAIYAEYDLLYPYDLFKLGTAAGKAEKEFYISLPHVCRKEVYDRLEKKLPFFLESNVIRGFLVKNFEEINLLQSLGIDRYKKKIILNHNMYVFNREAKEFWKERGIFHYCAPLEQNSRELKNLGISDCDLVVYGYLPLMVSAQCVYDNTKGCQRKLTDENKVQGYLVDRMGKKFPVQTNCISCYNTIYNGQCLSLIKKVKEVKELRPKNIRLDFTVESGEEAKHIMTLFADSFLKGKEPQWNKDVYTTGHFNRGIE